MASQRWRKYGIGIISTAFLLLIHAQVLAQSLDHQFKLGMETRLFRFLSATAEPENSDVEDDSDIVEFGLFSANSALLNDTVLMGVPASSFGADLAYGLSEHVLLGSHLMLDYGNIKDGEDISAVQFAIIPHLDYVFTASRRFRPFLGIQLGGQFTSVSSGNVDSDGKAFILGAELGAFGFVANSLSIDPRLSFLYSLGGADTAGIDWDINSISISLMIGLSGWL